MSVDGVNVIQHIRFCNSSFVFSDLVDWDDDYDSADVPIVGQIALAILFSC